MKGYKYGRWFISAGVLLGVPSLFDFAFGAMQNFYGALLLTIGLLCLRKDNQWIKASVFLTASTLLVLLVTSNIFLQGIAGLWTIGALTTLAYCSVISATKTSLHGDNQHNAFVFLKLGRMLILVTHIVFMVLRTILPIVWLGLLPLFAQLCMLLLLWLYGFAKRQPKEM